MEQTRYMNKLKCTGTAICLCSNCYIAHTQKYEKSLLRSDCDECYMQLCPLMNEYLEHYCGEHVPAPPPKVVTPHRNRANPETEYAFTLTMPPGYKTEAELINTAELILRKGCTADKPYEFACYGAYVLEKTEIGTPHIHGVYKTPSGRRIAQKFFKRAHKIWEEPSKDTTKGFKGGYHAPARHTQSYLNYMSKDGVVVITTSPETISTA